MTKEEAKKRVEKLKSVINRHRYLYHVLDRQEISDSALDSLKKELFDLEQKFPELITPDSPTQRVGGWSLKEFKKVRHFQPMLSFNDAFSEEDMKDWLERISKLLSKEELSRLDFFCELKFDGLAIELVYENGFFKIGSTRGDGRLGEDVTQNLKTIEAIPLKIFPIPQDLTSRQDLRRIVARGEVFISKKEFERLNKERRKKGLPEYANPRNVAAGSVRQLDPKITASRRLDSFIYDLVTDLGQKTHQEKHQLLKSLGFKVNSYSRLCRNLEEVFQFHRRCQSIRKGLPYEVDGIVVIVNSDKIFKKLGVAGKAPRGAVAFKFPLKQAETVIEGIRIQVGRTGALTPVACLRPVEIGGVTVSRATLHNEDEIKRLGLKIGDTVIVGRAGDVIPDIVKVLPELRTGREKEFKMPNRCPACGSPIKKLAGEAVYFCPNPDCFARRRRALAHFVSKGAFDIEGLGPKIIDQLVENGLIVDAADFFKLKEGDLTLLERFAEKSADNLIQAIQSKKEISLPRFIYALGIRQVGEETARDLAEYFGSLEKLKQASFGELEKIKDIGPIAAKSIYQWFHQKRNLKFLEKLKKAGVRIKRIKNHKSRVEKKLKGKIFVLTGGLNSFTREEAKEKIRELGGEVSESVSRKTDFLVVGKNPGSKLAKAEKLGARIIGEEEFREMIE
jgi:DNA ligase (NAD+)